MCCFATRVFLLISATVLSFVLHGFFPQIPVVAFYFLLANLISLTIFSLFFAGKLPSFVKPAAVHYFSFIGGFAAGLAVALFKREKAVAKFVKITKEITDEKDLLFIAYKTNGFNVNINANSYLFQEGTGDKYENARYSKVVLVDNKLRLIDLRDKDFKEIK